MAKSKAGGPRPTPERRPHSLGNGRPHRAFLDDKRLYPQEWNDFVDTPQHDWRMDAYRRCCYELEPIVNSPEPQDPIALSVLRSLVVSLRAWPASHNG
jgi:hypothetical protein